MISRKMISLAMALLMVLSIVPFGAYADDVYAAPAEYYFNNFEGLTEVPSGISMGSSNAAVTLENGKLKLMNSDYSSSTTVRAILGNVAISSAPVVIEFAQEADSANKNTDGMRIKSSDGNWATAFAGTRSVDLSGIKYVVYDPATGTATPYTTAMVSGTTNTDLAVNPSSIDIEMNTIIQNDERYFLWDYIAVYEQKAMNIALENVTTQGATLKTTLPVDVANSNLTVGSVATSITKVNNTYNTYNLTFASSLNAGAEYTLSGALSYLGGTEAYVASYIFNTPTKVYSVPTQRYFNNFEGLTEVPADYSYSKSGILTMADGKLHLSKSESGTDADCRSTLSNISIGTEPVVIEFEQAGAGANVSGAFNIIANESTRTAIYSGDTSLTDTKYVVFDPIAGTATPYISGFTAGATVGGINQTADEFAIGLWATASNTSKYLEWDYIAVYDYEGMAITLEDVTTDGATLKTTLPIDITNTTLTVGAVSATVTKVSDTYNTYTLAFDSSLNDNSDYTLAGTIAYLGGTYNASYAFKTPKKAFSAPQGHYFQAFEAIAEVPVGIAANKSTLSIVDGKLHMISDGNGYQPRAVFSDISVEGSSDQIVIEYAQSYDGFGISDGFQVLNGSSWIDVAALSDGDLSGVKYVVYNLANGTAVPYSSSLEAGAEATGLKKGGPITFRFNSNGMSGDKYLEWDHIAIYDLSAEMMIELEDITTLGAVIKTTIPVNIEASELKVGDVDVSIEKIANTYNTYNLTFAEELSSIGDYTLSGALAYLGGSTQISYAFANPVKALVFSNLTVDESEGIKAMVNATNNSAQRAWDVIIAVASYKDGELLDVSFDKVSIIAGSNNTVYTSAAIFEQGTSYKTFLWTTNLTPLECIQK